MSCFQQKVESFMYIEFLKAQSKWVRVDASAAKHKPSQTSIYYWNYLVKLHKGLDISIGYLLPAMWNLA